jgi:excinuclease ABC subunit A
LQPLAKTRGYRPSYFSFNIEGGRCEECQGEGKIKIEMQFMADLWLVCDSCKGQRFKDEILEVKVNELNINDVLNLSIDETLEFYKHPSIRSDMGNRFALKLIPLVEVGNGYLQLWDVHSNLFWWRGSTLETGFVYKQCFKMKNQPCLFLMSHHMDYTFTTLADCLLLSMLY